MNLATLFRIIRVLSALLFVFSILVIKTSWFDTYISIDNDNLNNLKYISIIIYALTYIGEYLIKKLSKNDKK